MFANFDISTRQLLTGNFCLIVCSGFYLLWWIIAFKPVGGIRGMKSGWLLLPALFFGIAAIIMIVLGCNGIDTCDALFSKTAILIGGVVVYIVLFIVTRIAMKRPVTAELLLIVGWTVLTFMELNALYGTEKFAMAGTIVFLVVTVAAAVTGLVCYLLYYGLEGKAGYIDGMLPLVLVAGVMVSISVGVVTR